MPDDAHSEGMAATLRERDLLGRAWLHVRAAEGRAQLQRAIANAGGRYVIAVAYRTERLKIPSMVLRSLLPSSERGEGFDANHVRQRKRRRSNSWNCSETRTAPTRARERLEAVSIIAIGPVTVRAVEQLGFSVAGVAERPDDRALVDAIERALNARSSSTGS